jgi:hypothetical protein
VSRSGTSGASGTSGSVSVCGMNQSKSEFKQKQASEKQAPYIRRTHGALVVSHLESCSATQSDSGAREF